ncbi:unnamed protein product [Medioppia subpectinata]|uniref:Uncharacterized protein n=1 Tax=Medioppia subpectinata TaxID=1979941 RepID=A0A7R9L5S3_9ACAR|nr:unnamed protein product [Medioppia subpectinata]CAG2115025.1 unnamed protein product [Medioppia subpectinata]
MCGSSANRLLCYGIVSPVYFHPMPFGRKSIIALNM